MVTKIGGDVHHRLARLCLDLQGYTFEVQHRAGKLHLDADAVSRLLRKGEVAYVNNADDLRDDIGPLTDLDKEILAREFPDFRDSDFLIKTIEEYRERRKREFTAEQLKEEEDRLRRIKIAQLYKQDPKFTPTRTYTKQARAEKADSSQPDHEPNELYRDFVIPDEIQLASVRTEEAPDEETTEIEVNVVAAQFEATCEQGSVRGVCRSTKQHPQRYTRVELCTEAIQAMKQSVQETAAEERRIADKLKEAEKRIVPKEKKTKKKGKKGKEAKDDAEETDQPMSAMEEQISSTLEDTG
jgi:hypothetical protein